MSHARYSRRIITSWSIKTCFVYIIISTWIIDYLVGSVTVWQSIADLDLEGSHALLRIEEQQRDDPTGFTIKHIISKVMPDLGSPSEMTFSHTLRDPGSGQVYNHLQQTVYGIPVVGGNTVIASNSDGEVTHVYGSPLLPEDINTLSPPPMETKQSAKIASKLLLDYISKNYATVDPDASSRSNNHEFIKHWQANPVWYRHGRALAKSSLKKNIPVVLAHHITGSFELQTTSTGSITTIEAAEDSKPVEFEAYVDSDTGVILEFIQLATSVVSSVQQERYELALAKENVGTHSTSINHDFLHQYSQENGEEATGLVSSLFSSNSRSISSQQSKKQKKQKKRKIQEQLQSSRRLTTFESDVSMSIIDKRLPHEVYFDDSTKQLPQRQKDVRNAVKYIEQGAHLIASLSNQQYLSFEGATRDATINAYIHWKEFSAMVYKDVLVFGNGFVVDDVVNSQLYGLYSRHISKYAISYQSGAIYYGFSYIFGESVDLLNKATADDDIDAAVSHDVERYEHLPARCTTTDWEFKVGQTGLDASTRWILGEGIKSKHFIKPIALFDMYSPECFGAPSTLYSDNVYCGDKDNGGVQTNAGVITRLFATLVDGGDYADPLDPSDTFLLVVPPLGMTKVLNLFWRVQLALPSYAQFDDLARVLSATCRANVGTPLYVPDITGGTSVVSSVTIKATDCDSVDVAINGAGLDIDWPCDM